jgi:hypothetical protein
MVVRLPVPGVSFLRERTIRLHAGPADPGEPASMGMGRPSQTEDGWWLTHAWLFDADGIIDTSRIAPRAGPPPAPPLLIMGPVFAGALSGLIAQEGGRQLVRLKLHPAPVEARPWERPLIVQIAIRWDPLTTATMRPNALAAEALEALARAVEAAGRPR